MGTGFDDSRISHLGAVMARHVDAGHAPGAVWLVARHGDTQVGACGATEVDGAVPVDRRTIFRISSMTKPITAALVMTLVEDCTLRLDGPVAEHLPELAEPRVLEHLDAPLSWTVPAERPITVRDLLTFTAGLGSVFAEPGTMPIADALEELELGQGGPPDPWVPPEPDEWIRRLASLPLLFQPGAAWAYNTCADVLGVLVARATGLTFAEALRQRLLDPLGMVDTGFHVPADDLGRLATAYMTAPDGTLTAHDPPDGRWASAPAFASGAGGLVSTVDDLHAFAHMLLDGGVGPPGRVLSRASVGLMTSDQLTPSQRASADLGGGFDHASWGFGLGVQLERRDLGPSVGAYGWDGGLGTAWTIDPAEDLVAILLTQAAWPSPTPPAIFADFTTATYAALTDG